MKKWYAVPVFIVLIFSNIYLIYQNSALLSEQRKWLLYQVPDGTDQDDAGGETLDVLAYLMSLKSEKQVNISRIFLWPEKLSVELDAEDMKGLESAEGQITGYLERGNPQMEVVRRDQSVHATLEYGGEE